MRPAAQWVLLSSVLSVALAVPPTEDGDNAEAQQTFPHPAECCDFNKAVPSMNRPELKSCAGFAHDDSINPDENCMIECVLSENGLINEDKTLNEQKFRTLFIEKADPNAKSALEASLNECFRDFDNSIKINSCDSGVDVLFACIISDVVMKCPDKIWQKSKPMCKDTKALYDSALQAAFGEQ